MSTIEKRTENQRDAHVLSRKFPCPSVRVGRRGEEDRAAEEDVAVVLVAVLFRSRSRC